MYLYGGTCLANCPDGTVVNITTGKCDGCAAGCKVCNS